MERYKKFYDSYLDFVFRELLFSDDDRTKDIAFSRHKDVFGYGENTATYSVLAERHGISKERVRQIAAKLKRCMKKRMNELGSAKAKPNIVEVKYIDSLGMFRDAPKQSVLVNDAMSLSTRTKNCLRLEGIETIQQLLTYSTQDLLRIPNFGRRSYNELVYELNKFSSSILKTEQKGN